MDLTIHGNREQRRECLQQELNHAADNGDWSMYGHIAKRLWLLEHEEEEAERIRRIREITRKPPLSFAAPEGQQHLASNSLEQWYEDHKEWVHTDHFAMFLVRLGIRGGNHGIT